MTRTDRPYIVDESAPEAFRIPSGTQRIWFENPDDRPVVRARLMEAIEREPQRGNIDGIEIGWSSRMEFPWVAVLFPNLETVILTARRLQGLDGLELVSRLRHLFIDTQSSMRRSLSLLPRLELRSLGVRVRPKDIEFVSERRSLNYLALSSWPLADLTTIGLVSARHVRISGGSSIRVAGLNCSRLDELWLMQCMKLQSVSGVRVPYVVVSACNRLRLETLGEIEGLTTLWVRDQKLLPSLEFLRTCRTLQSIMVDTSRVTATDWDSVIEHHSLIHASFTHGVPDDAVTRVACANRRLAITNGSLYFFRGERVSTNDWYLLVREQAQSTGADAPSGLSE